jgi:hypothetical protein
MILGLFHIILYYIEYIILSMSPMLMSPNLKFININLHPFIPLVPKMKLNVSGTCSRLTSKNEEGTIVVLPFWALQAHKRT